MGARAAPVQASAEFLARRARALERRIAEKIADGVPRARAEQLAALEVRVEGDFSLPSDLSPERDTRLPPVV